MWASKGLIPARAGNTPCRTPVQESQRAHPRSRGEHCCAALYRESRLGSSPLARGTRFAGYEGFVVHGLIPARAGNTLAPESSRSVPGAHPRSRGEHFTAATSNSSETGSSPLARGTLRAQTGSRRETGLIPARAGNTSGVLIEGVAPKAHPRSRGEHSGSFPVVAGAGGSSPLARGTRSRPRPEYPERGLIPARAGNTPLLSWYPKSRRAHPRSRGEHLFNVRNVSKLSGSSPLARGTPG